ncbi:DUF1349 domain-containing protein [Pontibacter sp. KCTC 32443]|uniref:DUF1349 domain-containing protein n=1 Tax=Pontibacter TaxID=323449 RepID=UPI00164CE807|nr:MULTISPECIES: DUF1349 domain-containing protein [Pontibacter]MBC5775338.1 DUF1349 domain-containing protein [Pontibacter sp. KCTC 32443]
MKKMLLLAAALCCATAASAQPTNATPPTANLPALNDEFNSTKLTDGWKNFHEVEGWVNKMIKQDVNSTSKGHLYFEPGTSGWFADQQAPFMFKEITGDFDVRVRMKVSGRKGDVPQSQWSLAGLMARAPKRGGKDTWKPGEENWMFMTTGIAEELGKPVIETKKTISSHSSLKLRPAKLDWIEMRLVRVGPSFVLLYKYDNDKTWTVRERFYNVDMPRTLQVGLIGYTNSYAVDNKIKFGDPVTYNNTTYDHLGNPDLAVRVDYIRFQKPKVEFGKSWLASVAENNLTDYSLSNDELLKLVGN